LVATAVGGLPELVGDAAVLVPPGRVDALGEALTQLLDDPALRTEFARRGSARAAGWPTESDTLAVVAAAYDRVIALRLPTAGRLPGVS
jgi:glycosyltransferase involved in cell wall biosynthesis